MALRPEGFTVVGATLGALNLVAAVLFLRRSLPRAHASARDVALCLGSVALGGGALALAPPFDRWPGPAEVGFALAGGATIVALSGLGRSFAVLPSRRRLVTRGPYRWVRHPVYAAESLMVVAAVTAGPAWETVAVAAGAIGLLVVRIRIEERFLTAVDAAYATYCQRVRYRLLPGVW